MIYPVNGTRLKLAACFAEGLALWAEQLEDDLEFAPGWLDPRVCWFELLEERLGPKHPETIKAGKKAFVHWPEIFCLIILPLLTGSIV